MDGIKINNLRQPNAGFARTDVPPGCEPAGLGAISAWVEGTPAPQGSKRALRAGSRITMIEMSKKVKPWRKAVREAFEAERVRLGVELFPTAAVIVKIVFVMHRPVATPKTKVTPHAVKKPDLDKLIRSTFDAIGEAGVWTDDSQVVTVHAHKRIAELGEATGAVIHVEPVTDPSLSEVIRSAVGGVSMDEELKGAERLADALKANDRSRKALD